MKQIGVKNKRFRATGTVIQEDVVRKFGVAVVAALTAAVFWYYKHQWQQLFKAYEAILSLDSIELRGDPDKVWEARLIRIEARNKSLAGLKQMGADEGSIKSYSVMLAFELNLDADWWLEHEAEIVSLDEKGLVNRFYEMFSYRPRQ